MFKSYYEMTDEEKRQYDKEREKEIRNKNPLAYGLVDIEEVEKFIKTQDRETIYQVAVLYHRNSKPERIESAVTSIIMRVKDGKTLTHIGKQIGRTSETVRVNEARMLRFIGHFLYHNLNKSKKNPIKLKE